MSDQKRKSGRPSIQTGLSMQKELQEYFLQGYDAEFTSVKTGHDIKTVYKYFHEFSDEIIKSDTGNFLDKQKTERARIIISLDRQIYDANKFAHEIQSEIKKFRDEKKATPRYLITSYIQVMKYMTSIIETRGSFAMKPSMNQALQDRLKEMHYG